MAIIPQFTQINNMGKLKGRSDNINKRATQQPISPKTLRRTLRALDDEFIFDDLYEYMNGRKVLGTLNEKAARSRLRRMIKINAVEPTDEKRTSDRTGWKQKIYKKKERYRKGS